MLDLDAEEPPDALSDGTLDLAANRPVFYCLEDSVKVE